MIHTDDDGIVVGMKVDFDWDRFEAEGEEIARRMREVSRTMSEQNAASRAARARHEERIASRDSVARETPPPAEGGIEARLDRFERTLTAMAQDVWEVRRDLTDVRERMATKVELEALTDKVSIIADGYAQTQTRLGETSNLLKRYLTAAE